jgi:hypothetical protein
MFLAKEINLDGEIYTWYIYLSKVVLACIEELSNEDVGYFWCTSFSKCAIVFARISFISGEVRISSTLNLVVHSSRRTFCRGIRG